MLRGDLSVYDRYLERSARDAEALIRARGIDGPDRDRFVSWQKAQLTRLQAALAHDEPLAALLDAWAVSESLLSYLDSPAGRRELSSGTWEVARDMLVRRQERLRLLARAYLSPEAFAELVQGLDDFTAAHPIPEDEALKPDKRKLKSDKFSLWAMGEKTLGAILSLPLAPGRAASGISESGKALTEMRVTTAEAVKLAAEMPAMIRRELETLLATLMSRQDELLRLLVELEHTSSAARDTSVQVRATVEEVRATITEAGAQLPAGEALAAALEGAAHASTELVDAIATLLAQQRAAADGGAPAGSATAAAGVTNRAAGFQIADYQHTAFAIEDAAAETRRLIAEIAALRAPAATNDAARQPAPDDEPFDIRQYRATAEALAQASDGIRSAVQDVRALAENPDLDARVVQLRRESDRAVAHAADQATRVIDHAVWRLAQLALLCAILYLAVRRFSRRG